MDKLSTSDIVIIACVVFTGLVTIVASDIIYSHQNTVNKQSAAKQMLIEIISFNETLQTYADIYKKGLDLNYGGGNPAAIDNKNNFFIISNENSSSIPIFMELNDSGIYQKQIKINSIHNGEISWTNPDIFPPNIVYFSQLDTPIIPPSLYNERGAYYLYAKEISNFNMDESQDLYLFYNILTKAEADRVSLQTYYDTYGYNSELNGQYFNTYIDMRFNIIYAAKIEPHVIEILENEIK